MHTVPEIDVDEARQLHQKGAALFVDIRDAESRAEGAVEGALALTQETYSDFVASTEKDQPLVVYCYHGNSSRMVTEMLREEGFSDVRSLRGGFERWSEV